MVEREKVNRIIYSIMFTVSVFMLASKSPIIALTFLAYCFCCLWYHVEDIKKVVSIYLPQLQINITDNIKDNFNKMKKEIPDRIIKAFKKDDSEKLLKCTVIPGGVNNRGDAIEVIREFQKHGIEVYYADTSDKRKLLNDDALINIALNLIELKSQAENAAKNNITPGGV